MSQQLTILDQTHEKFVSIYQAVHKVDRESAENFFTLEKFTFTRMIQESESLAACSPISVAGVFLEVISNGLSFDKSSNHVYLIPRGGKLTYSYAADGLVYLCTAAGSILSCDRPTIVYEGDSISVGSIEGKTVINFSKSIPRKSSTIVGGFVTLTLPNGDREQFWMGIEEIPRLVSFSSKANRGTANKLYTAGDDGQIDPGFFATKIVKAALKNKRRKRVLQDHYTEEETIPTDAEIMEDEKSEQDPILIPSSINNENKLEF